MWTWATRLLVLASCTVSVRPFHWPTNPAWLLQQQSRSARTGVVTQSGISEFPRTVWLNDEVPSHDLQRWVAWYEFAADDFERRDKRSELLLDHLDWCHECMLPFQKEQLASEEGIEGELASNLTEAERTMPRLLWEKALYPEGGMFVNGMLLCGAAADHDAFVKLVEEDPYVKEGIFSEPQMYKWNQVDEPDLRWEPIAVSHVLLCFDKAGALETRKATREAHLSFMRAAEKVIAAGPLLPVDGDSPIGSLVFVPGADTDDVRSWSSEDPYTQAGLFERVEVRRYMDVDITGLYVMDDPQASSSYIALDSFLENKEEKPEKSPEEDEDIIFEPDQLET